MKRDQNGFGAVEALLVLVIVAVIGFVGYYVWHIKNATDNNLSPTQTTTPKFKAKSSSSTQPSSGTDKASLNNDLNGVNSAMTQESNDSNSANSALNDQQNQISVPTN